MAKVKNGAFLLWWIIPGNFIVESGNGKLIHKQLRLSILTLFSEKCKQIKNLFDNCYEHRTKSISISMGASMMLVQQVTIVESTTSGMPKWA